MAERATAPLLAAMLVAGLSFAAFRAWTWSDRAQARTLIVVAPEQATVSIVDGPRPMDATLGVHSWTVQPGPLTLSVVPMSGETQQTQIEIPRGLGGLMLELSFDATGQLQLGYF